MGFFVGKKKVNKRTHAYSHDADFLPSPLETFEDNHTYPFVFPQLFKEDEATGETHLALSSDSTCVNGLRSSREGYETLTLTPKRRHSVGHRVNSPSAVNGGAGGGYRDECVFPDWMQGAWEDVSVEGGELRYRDGVGFVSYRGRCVRMHPGHPDRFVVEMETGCGERAHRCLLFQQRDRNVMEFQLGKHLKVFCFMSKLGREK